MASDCDVLPAEEANAVQNAVHNLLPPGRNMVNLFYVSTINRRSHLQARAELGP